MHVKKWAALRSISERSWQIDCISYVSQSLETQKTMVWQSCWMTEPFVLSSNMAAMPLFFVLFISKDWLQTTYRQSPFHLPMVTISNRTTPKLHLAIKKKFCLVLVFSAHLLYWGMVSTSISDFSSVESIEDCFYFVTEMFFFLLLAGRGGAGIRGITIIINRNMKKSQVAWWPLKLFLVQSKRNY